MIENLLSIITKLRNIKATLKIEPKDIIEVYSPGGSKEYEVENIAFL